MDQLVPALSSHLMQLLSSRLNWLQLMEMIIRNRQRLRQSLNQQMLVSNRLRQRVNLKLRLTIPNTLNFKPMLTVRSEDAGFCDCKKILVLDSSFNPPHIAHKKQLENAAALASLPIAILLLFATNNADKNSVSDDVVNTRLNLMRCFRQDLVETITGVPIAIATTDKPMFVDKADVLLKHYGKPIQFLMGFDTLVRIIDQKYYSQPVNEVFSSLGDHVSFLVLTRSRDDSFETDKTVDDQAASNLPDFLESKVTIVKSSQDTVGVSSSKIRQLASANESFETLCTKSVADYVEKHSLYK